jgi:hypothetical protein
MLIFSIYFLEIPDWNAAGWIWAACVAIDHTRRILLKKELVEAVKMKNYPGIISADGATAAARGCQGAGSTFGRRPPQSEILHGRGHQPKGSAKKDPGGDGCVTDRIHSVSIKPIAW